MSSRPLSSAITPFQQAAIARALPYRGAPGVLHHTMVGAEGRRFAVTAARPVGDGDWEAAFSAVVARRTAARLDRLLPVVATGCHDGYHWVAYETGLAPPLVDGGWRRWPTRLALELVSDVANALDDAAAFGIVPYELLPSSIFMDARVGPLLGDLGAAREAVGSPPADDDPGRAFTPPEVIDGGVAGARSSVFVCGALLYCLLAGGPPRHDRVTRWRSELPEEIDLVLTRAMARDTLERYRSAAEFCESAKGALEDHLAAEPDEPEEPAEEEVAVEPRVEQPPPRGHRADAPPEEYAWIPRVSRTARLVRLGVVAGAVALGAVVGFQTAQPDPPARASGFEVAGAGVRLTLPAGWFPGPSRGSVLLSAYPGTDWLAGLTIRQGEQGSAPRTGSDPVRLGDLDLWRDTSDAPTVVRYVLPTSAGPLQISCEATPRGALNTLSVCERSLSTLSLDEARAVPLEGVARRPGVRAAVDELRRDRMTGRAELARARTPTAQRAAAISLQRANARAARRLERLDDDAALAAAAARAAEAYGALADSAGTRQKRAWNKALAVVRRAETALARELKQQG